MNERAQLRVLAYDTQTTRVLAQKGAATERELAVLEIRLEGQKNHVEQLELALERTTQQVRLALGLTEQGQQVLAPKAAQIQELESEIGRIDQQLAHCVIRSPIDGVVLKRHHSTGEFCQLADTVFTIPDDASRRVVLFLRQNFSDQLSVGDEVDVIAQPNDTSVRCRVARLGTSFTQAPHAIATRYRMGEPLREAHLVPVPEQGQTPELRPGQTVRLPRRWW